MSEKTQFRPCNGSEGEYFMDAWCSNCERDKDMNGTCHNEGREPSDEDYCEILGRSFRSDEPLPEWVIGADGPQCLAFVPMGDKSVAEAVRCEATQDMFGA